MIQRRSWQHRFLVAITDEPFIHHEESFAAQSSSYIERHPACAWWRPWKRNT